MEGGNVVNLAIELNGQPPLQAYVKPCREPHIVLRSIDLGASELVETYEQLAEYNKVGSPFSIPKAALTLAGFGRQTGQYATLAKQLEDFGCGIELTLLSAIPAGSGLGTSSILAATVLGALNDFCNLGWNKNEIGHRTLILEQLLTTGGGWQDQFGGILGGIKLLQTKSGLDQNPLVHWLPDALYTQPEYAQCHLLYYTGITRTAKQILAEPNAEPIHKGRALFRLSQFAFNKNNKELYDSIYNELMALKASDGIGTIEPVVEVNHEILNGNYEEALRLCEQLAPEKKAERMAVIYHRMGNDQKAYEQMAKFKKINDSIVLVSHGNVVASCFVQMNNERLKLEQKILEEENAQLRRWITLIVVAAIVFFLGFLAAFVIGVGKLWCLAMDVPERLVTDSPFFYIALTMMIIGTQLFVAGFLGDLVSRSSQNRNDYQIEKTI
jgi:mevalonate kinase